MRFTLVEITCDNCGEVWEQKEVSESIPISYGDLDARYVDLCPGCEKLYDGWLLPLLRKGRTFRGALPANRRVGRRTDKPRDWVCACGLDYTAKGSLDSHIRAQRDPIRHRPVGT
jgi:hypothetical protein